MNSKRNYPLLLGSQFLSAFGDNAILSVILGPLTFARAAGTITEAQVNSANPLYSAVFFLPFILLAPLAGFLNDRYSKTRWLLGGNMIKLLGTLTALTGLLLENEWFAMSYLIIGIGACAYSPAKYGIPETSNALKVPSPFPMSARPEPMPSRSGTSSPSKSPTETDCICPPA